MKFVVIRIWKEGFLAGESVTVRKNEGKYEEMRKERDKESRFNENNNCN